jgi:1-acyl-sn-glycerol-3-phosphate acyltransferase
MNEIFSELHIIPSDYHVMKGTLEAGESFSVSAGGMREMLYENTSLLSKRRGIFKMALETGTPLVPVISVDDNRLWKTVDMPGWIQDALKPYDMCIPVPTLKSVYKWLGMLRNPLKDPIRSIIGTPILVEKAVAPSESDIAELRRKYIDALQKMYKTETGNELIVQ